MKSFIRFHFILPFILSTLFLSTTGCSPTYVYHAAKGQYQLLHDSIPVEEALAGETLGTEEDERLRLVALVKAFGEEELGLKKTENYQTVYLESNRAPMYVLTASPKDRLRQMTWWFPIVGKLHYLPFFDLEEAKKKKENLLHKDLDVFLGVADAYSTLGWFNDPVTMNLLEGSTLDLVETILHEMTHTTLYLKGEGEFNEGLAVLVGKAGAVDFFESKYGPCDPLTIEAKKSIADERVFSSYLDSLLNELEQLYNSPISFQEKLIQREKVFASFLDRFVEVKAQLQTDYFIHFGMGGLNNAYLMAIGLYHRNFALFDALVKEKNNSVIETIAYLRDISKKEELVLEWLKNHVKETSP
ncbi:MAG: aminopeptidase [Deltaproteobacteria bacterium]|nr:aminopeptidase [Deltaproteobacteria bacterium]